MRTEKSINAPFLGTDETRAREVIAGKHRLAQTLNVYGEAGQQSKLRAGQFLDEVKTWVRVLASRVNGQVLDVRFYPNGRLGVGWYWGPQDQDPYLGGRSVGV